MAIPKEHPQARRQQAKRLLNGFSHEQVLRDTILAALQAVGGQAYLARQAEENPVAFMALLGRLVPLQAADPGKRLSLA